MRISKVIDSTNKQLGFCLMQPNGSVTVLGEDYKWESIEALRLALVKDSPVSLMDELPRGERFEFIRLKSILLPVLDTPKKVDKRFKDGRATVDVLFNSHFMNREPLIDALTAYPRYLTDLKSCRLQAKQRELEELEAKMEAAQESLIAMALKSTQTAEEGVFCG